MYTPFYFILKTITGKQQQRKKQIMHAAIRAEYVLNSVLTTRL
jgi:hypothetical protein